MVFGRKSVCPGRGALWSRRQRGAGAPVAAPGSCGVRAAPRARCAGCWQPLAADKRSAVPHLDWWGCIPFLVFFNLPTLHVLQHGGERRPRYGVAYFPPRAPIASKSRGPQQSSFVWLQLAAMRLRPGVPPVLGSSLHACAHGRATGTREATATTGSTALGWPTL